MKTNCRIAVAGSIRNESLRVKASRGNVRPERHAVKTTELAVAAPKLTTAYKSVKRYNHSSNIACVRIKTAAQPSAAIGGKVIVGRENYA